MSSRKGVAMSMTFAIISTVVCSLGLDLYVKQLCSLQECFRLGRSLVVVIGKFQSNILIVFWIRQIK